MAAGTLVNEQVSAATRFLREFEKSTQVVAAYWLKDSEEDRWDLYVVSDRFNDGVRRTAYGDVCRVTNSLNDPVLDPSRVKLVGLSEPTAKAVLDFYKTRPPRIPFYVHGRSIGNVEIAEAYFIKGPTGDYTMPSGREALDQIIDGEAAFFKVHGTPPRKMKLPVLLAYDLAKCGRDQLGDLSGRVFKDGITVFEREGFHGMTVEIIRDRDANLEFE
jgi:hypothetical protein